MNISKIILISLLLSGCSKGQGISLHPYKDRNATPQNFTLCHGFSCTYKTQVSIPEKEWEKIISLFTPYPKSARSELNTITQAIAMIEKEVTKASGMNPDRAKAENFEPDEDQMDCLDETINTSRYLRFLDKEISFKWYEPSEPIHRGYFIDGMWPHNSATLREKSTGHIYAVDTYYADNGIKPYIIPRDIWLDNWTPDKE
ncbi:MAG: hypothetical protein ACRBB3_03375 [Alphaproteobacteria bacterium]